MDLLQERIEHLVVVLRGKDIRLKRYFKSTF